MDRRADDTPLELQEITLPAHDQRLKIVGVLRDALVAVLRHQHRVRMPEPADLREVQRRFDADDHVLGQHVLAARAQPGLLVIAQPDAVSCAVDNAVAVTIRFEELLRGQVDVAAAHAGPDQAISDRPGLHDDIVQAALLCGRLAQEHRALDLGRITVDAVVAHQHDRPGAHAHVQVGQGMRLRALRCRPAGGDEAAVEVVKLAGGDHPGLQVAGRHGRLDHRLAGIQPVVQFGHAFVGPRRRRADGRDLVGRLDHAHLSDERRNDRFLHLQQRGFGRRQLRLHRHPRLRAEHAVQFVVPVAARQRGILKVGLNVADARHLAHVHVLELRHHQLRFTLGPHKDEKRPLHRHVRSAGEVVDGILGGNGERVQPIGLQVLLQFANARRVIVLAGLGLHGGFVLPGRVRLNHAGSMRVL